MKNVLIVEDNIDLQNIYKIAFGAANIPVVIKSNGLEAIAEITEIDPAIILLDLLMPDLDGFKFMEDFEKLPEEKLKMYLPCFLTSSINEGDISYAKNFKTIKQYINKPLSQKLIQNLISTLE